MADIKKEIERQKKLMELKRNLTHAKRNNMIDFAQECMNEIEKLQKEEGK